MARIVLCLLAAGSAMAGEIHFRQSGFAAGAEGWTAWSIRAETAPRTLVEPAVSVGEPGSLAVSGNGNIGAFGGWQRIIPDIRPGAWYRFTASYRAAGVTSENWQILPRVDWRSGEGKRARSHVDYVARSERQGAWTKVTLETQAHPGATSAALQLFLAHAPSGIVWWDQIEFEEIPAPGPRPVTIATINLRPQSTRAAAESVRQFLEMADQTVPAGADLVLFPEGITVIGTGKSYTDVSEPIPGPTSERLSAFARRKHAYVAAGLYERDGAAVYNTSVLFDRGGNVIGRYRKVHLPQNEMEELTPGQ
ncbi:MAG: carbon-nitrogen hydrolase family protein [Bryobacteraceae bacterium]